MALIKTVMFILLQTMFTTSAPDTKLINHSIQGVIVSKTDGKPLENIYLYAVKGEEEAISNSKGEFKFVSWQKLPLTLYVQHKDNEHVRVVVSNPKEFITIKL